MDKSQQVRWAVLLSALAATITAIFLPVDEAPARRATPERPLSMQEKRENKPVVNGAEPPRDWLATEDNPFAPRGWTAPPLPPPSTQARTVAPVILAEATPPPGPAPLPFRFLGRMSDGDDRVIYLGQGDQLVPARQGDLLDGHYKVVLIGAAQMEFEDTTSGLRQLLPLPVQDK
ncbi:hypothetical protein RugamoR57_49210 [Duganella caerulea]|uniref:hypothetical protein n=1 Tax=Duganella caerulea TaxID=2885762 RepID=UPI0030E76BE0